MSDYLLSPSLITREALCVLVHRYDKQCDLPCLWDGTNANTQTAWCEFIFNVSDLTLTLDDFSERYIRVAAASLAEQLPDGAGPFYLLKLPTQELSFSARESFKGISVRLVGVVDALREAVTGRFDLCFEVANA